MTPQEAWAQFASDWRAGFEAALAPLFEGSDETFSLELESALVELAQREGHRLYLVGGIVRGQCHSPVERGAAPA